MSIIPQLCPNCGAEFTPTRRRKKFCSKSCAGQFVGRSTPKGRVNAGSFKSGMTTWNKGKTGDQSHMHGRKMPPHVRELVADRSRGARSNLWKGGVSPEHERLRKTKEYKDWRAAVFERDGYTCQMCGSKSVAGHRVRLHADHIKPFATYIDLRFDVSNGRTLCVDCHKQTPTYGRHKGKAETGQQAVKVDTVSIDNGGA